MIIRLLSLVAMISIPLVTTEFCGNNKIPFGLEVHRDGRLTLLCSRPNCHEKKYAECPERPQQSSCPGNTSWVGGLEKSIDGQLFLQCCEYDLLEKYGDLIFDNVIVRPGEFYEGEEKFDSSEDEVLAFDLISDIRHKTDEKGQYYSLSIHRYHCGKLPDTPPAWYLPNHWPFWKAEKPSEDKAL